VLCAACVEGANRRDGHKDKHTLTLSVRGRTLEKKKGKEAGWGKPALFVSKVPFSPIFFAQISFGKRHFRHFRQQQSAIFAAFRSAKKSAVFR